MRILHISASNDRGGAAISLMGLHESLIEAGHQSTLLMGRTSCISPCIDRIQPMSWLGRLSFHGINQIGLNYAGIPGTPCLSRHPWFQAADIVHYHNLHGGFFNYRALPGLTRLKPSVWTLHDMWALTGHCAHSFDCQRWQHGCGHCPYPQTYPPIRRDATRLEWRIKQDVYRRSRFTIVTPSAWLAQLTRKSLLGAHTVIQVPNGIDSSTFVPRNRRELRAALGWPQDKIILLFAAESTASPFKNFALVLRSLGRMAPSRRNNVVLATLGEDDWKGSEVHGCERLSLGYHDNDSQKALYYAAADLFVFPTRAEVQGRVLLEAMSCGCPAVSVDVGGVPEIVRHGETGYLARAGDDEDFLQGLEALIADPLSRARMAETGRRQIIENYDIAVHLEKMLGVYDSALQSWHDDGQPA